MVEYSLDLDLVFGSLSDPTRRDILERLINGDLSVNQIARAYKISLAAISKHLKVLERAHLITKTRHGNEFVVKVIPEAMVDIDDYLDQYRQTWDEKLDKLSQVLNSNRKGASK